MENLPYALPPVTRWTDYWIAVQNQYAAEKAYLDAKEDNRIELCFAYIQACQATQQAWAAAIKEYAA